MTELMPAIFDFNSAMIATLRDLVPGHQLMRSRFPAVPLMSAVQVD